MRVMVGIGRGTAGWQGAGACTRGSWAEQEYGQQTPAEASMLVPLIDDRAWIRKAIRVGAGGEVEKISSP